VERRRVIDDRVNQTARRVAVHQVVDAIVDARRKMVGGGTAEALSDALDYLAGIPLYEPCSDEAYTAWRAVAAIAQGQLERAMEERAS
jgi:hypothetical protein